MVVGAKICWKNQNPRFFPFWAADAQFRARQVARRQDDFVDPARHEFCARFRSSPVQFVGGPSWTRRGHDVVRGRTNLADDARPEKMSPPFPILFSFP